MLIISLYWLGIDVAQLIQGMRWSAAVERIRLLIIEMRLGILAILWGLNRFM